jgi:hypothetical protein
MGEGGVRIDYTSRVLNNHSIWNDNLWLIHYPTEILAVENYRF